MHMLSTSGIYYEYVHVRTCTADTSIYVCIYINIHIHINTYTISISLCIYTYIPGLHTRVLTLIHSIQSELCMHGMYWTRWNLVYNVYFVYNVYIVINLNIVYTGHFIFIVYHLHSICRAHIIHNVFTLLSTLYSSIHSFTVRNVCTMPACTHFTHNACNINTVYIVCSV